MSKSVDDLVAAVPASQSAPGCWAQSLKGDAAEFVQKIKDKEEKLGRPLHRGTILDNLREHFDVTLGVEALTKHLKGRCRCG